MRAFITVLLALAAGCSTTVIEPRADYAFINVNVLEPASGQVVPGQTVLVTGERITAVGAGLDIPATALRIDGRGRYLLPGLAEMHAHVPKQNDGEEYLNDVLFLYVANGITTIRGMNGEAAHLELRERIRGNEIIAPRLVTAGPPLLGKGAGTAEEAAQKVVDQAAAGYDFIKVHMGLPAEVYAATATAAAEQDIAIAGHVAQDVGLQRALTARQASIDHLDSYWPALIPDGADTGDADYGLMGAPLTPWVDPSKMPELARATAAAGVWNAPTLSAMENFVRPVERPDELRYMPPRLARGWVGAAKGYQKNLPFDAATVDRFLQLRLELVKALHDAGAGVLLASDAPQILNVPGFSIHRELELLVEAGLTPSEAIAAGTTEAARFLDLTDEFGRVAVGLSADLLLVNENPFEDIAALRTPVGVMLRGTWLSADAIRSRLQNIAARHELAR